MAKASREDLRQMFEDTISIHKNKPYHVVHISHDLTCRARNLLTQREVTLPISEDTWSGPMQRLGYVNVSNSIVYVSRKPIRRYKAGLSKENMDLKYCDHAAYPKNTMYITAYLQGMTAIELADCIMGKYPTFEECIQKVTKEGVRAIAFDRQFAMNDNGVILYKNSVVGQIIFRSAKTINDIVFDAEHTHLVTLLGNNYEKVLSVGRS